MLTHLIDDRLSVPGPEVGDRVLTGECSHHRRQPTGDGNVVLAVRDRRIRLDAPALRIDEVCVSRGHVRRQRTDSAEHVVEGGVAVVAVEMGHGPVGVERD